MKYYRINPKTNTLISRHKTKELAKKDNYIVRKFNSINDFNSMVDFVQIRGDGAWDVYCDNEERCI